MANTSLRIPGSVEVSARCVKVGSGYYGKRLQKSVCLLSSFFQSVLPTVGGTDQISLAYENVAIEYIPPPNQDSSFTVVFSWFPGRIRAMPKLYTETFKMLMLKVIVSQTRSKSGLQC